MTRSPLILPLVLLAATPAVALSPGQNGAQTPPASSGRSVSDLTRDLNSGPPFAVAPRQTPATAAPAKPVTKPSAKPAPASEEDEAAAPAAPAASPRPDSDAVEPEETVTAEVHEGATDAEAASQDDAAAPDDNEADESELEVEAGGETEAESVPAAAEADEPEPDVETEAAAEAEAEAPPPPPAVTPLTAAERAALPFSVALPAGFEIVARPAGPQASVYSVRREDRSFVMIYAGPSSQFPIYDGQQAQVAGRTSIVVTEGGRRRAMEHLFQRDAAPREIHVWLTSLEGGDAALAEQIAQTVDPR